MVASSMNTLRDWHDFYLTLDVLLLTDVFEKFRWTMQKIRTDWTASSRPSMTLKVTDVEMELISDPNIYLMIESGIQVRSRGRKGELQALADRKHIKHRFRCSSKISARKSR